MTHDKVEVKLTKEAIEMAPVIYRIYGKLKTEKKYSAMDMDEGVRAKNLLYASIVEVDGKKLTEERFNTILESIAIDNPTWDFEKRLAT